jgi:hypothetical protein
MAYACPTWGFATETHLLKLQHLQNRVLCTIGNFPRNTSIQDTHVAFHVPYVYNYITKLCRRQEEIIHNHENVCNIGQGKTHTGKIRGLNLAAVTCMTNLCSCYCVVSLVVGIIQIVKSIVLRKVNQLLVGEINFKDLMQKLRLQLR